MADNPYSSLPDHRFWRKAVASLPPFALDPIVETPFKISPSDKVATAGSCFAQEIAHRLQQSGYHYYLPEQPPEGMPAQEAQRRNYSMYSCRYGNLYTTTQLLQLIQRAYGDFIPDLDVWKSDDGRIVDPFRPRIEPDGYSSVAEMHGDRARHFAAVRKMIETMDVFVFTFGLTECWRHKSDGAVLQLAPGVAGGDYDPQAYEFWNMSVGDVVRDFLASADLIHARNPNVRMILSVSPVSIIATSEDRHVLVSNSASKAILRAAADEVVRSRANIAREVARCRSWSGKRSSQYGRRFFSIPVSDAMLSTSPPRPRPTPGSSATKRRSKPPETRAIVRADADLTQKGSNS